MRSGIGSRPERSHRGLRPARLGDHPLEDDPAISEIVDDGRGLAPVSVETQPIRAKRIDEDEYDVQIAASPQQGEIPDRPLGRDGMRRSNCSATMTSSKIAARQNTPRGDSTSRRSID